MTSLRSVVKKLLSKTSFITVVSGLPRSGTSMMMKALQAGGMPLLVDGVRGADANNPGGYFEFERVKKLPKCDLDWLDNAKGKVVKVISALLDTLPDQYQYKVIFMERDIDEILASQRRMLLRDGTIEEKPISDADMRQSYLSHLEEVKTYLAKTPWLKTIAISYNDVLRNPKVEFQRVVKFLDRNVDLEAMVQVVDPELYRERK